MDVTVTEGHEHVGRISRSWLEEMTGDFGGGGFPVNSTSLALESSRIVKSGGGILFGFQGFNNGPAQFVQVHDANALPADGAIPQVVISVSAAANFSFALQDPWRAFSRGIVLCNSSTAATKTIGSANCWFDVQYA